MDITNIQAWKLLITTCVCVEALQTMHDFIRAVIFNIKLYYLYYTIENHKHTKIYQKHSLPQTPHYGRHEAFHRAFGQNVIMNRQGVKFYWSS